MAEDRTARQTALLEGPIFRSLLQLTIPIVLATILQSAYQLTDAFWVGRLGGYAVAAVTVSFPLMFLMIALGAGMAIAGSTLIAQYFGARNGPMVNHVAAQTLLMVALASVVFGTIGYSMAPAVLNAMGVEPEVLPAATQFMRVSFVGLVFVFGFAMIQAVLRGVGEVRLPLYIVFGTVLLNFVLDPLLIFGIGPIPATGVAGAALATIGTQSLAAVAGLALLLSGRYGIHLALHHFRPDLPFFKRAFLLGFPASVEQTARALGLTAMTFLVARFGTVTMAAYGIGFNVLSFVIIPAMGLSMATSTLVGQNIRQDRARRVDRAVERRDLVRRPDRDRTRRVRLCGPDREIFRTGRRRRHCRGRNVSANRRAVVRLHRSAADPHGRVSRLRQHGRHDDAGPRVAVGLPAPDRIHPRLPHRARRRGHLVGLSCIERVHRRDHRDLVSQRRLEENAAYRGATCG